MTVTLWRRCANNVAITPDQNDNIMQEQRVNRPGGIADDGVAAGVELPGYDGEMRKVKKFYLAQYK
ncbi:MAG: hypothetical protein ACYC1M_15250 [Armatimonadota bacterium]